MSPQRFRVPVDFVVIVPAGPDADKVADEWVRKLLTTRRSRPLVDALGVAAIEVGLPIPIDGEES